MKLLNDTHLLLWFTAEPKKLPGPARLMMQDPANELFFSSVSFWEIAIKKALNRPDFQPDPRLLHRELLARGFRELKLSSDHAMAVETLPPIHRDLFDRILIAQAVTEGMTLLTADSDIAQYPGPIRKV
jgi:PIN domain nuclease of toxin-antitoxin system